MQDPPRSKRGLVAEDGAILGRFNLRDIASGSAVLGYRVAENVAGHGVATTTVDQLCREAATAFGLRTIRAATSDANIASQRVLLEVGFVLIGRADPADLGGRPGSPSCSAMPITALEKRPQPVGRPRTWIRLSPGGRRAYLGHVQALTNLTKESHEES